MITCVTYTGPKTARFDRDYYVHEHLPLVRRIWGSVGLLALDAFFPADEGAGFVVLAICRFRDEKALQASLALPETATVMADVAHFTDIKPKTFRFADIDKAKKDTARS